MMRALPSVLVLSVVVSCGGDDGDGSGGAGGVADAGGGTAGAAAGGSAGTAGAGGGVGGTSGLGGVGGTSGGAGGSSASGGSAGTSGDAGTAGEGAAAGSGGATADAGNDADAAGTGGVGGTSGAAGTSGTAGTSGAGGTSGSGGAGGADGGTACGTITTFEAGRSPTRQLHVATTGSAGGNGSPGSPYATIVQAAAQATPGTAIVVHAGTYAGGMFVGNLAGTAAAPIWIGGAPGEARPVLQAGANGIQLSRVRYLVVHDLEVRLSTANGINCDDGAEYGNPDATRYVVFRDLAIRDIGSTGNQDCLKLSGLNDFWVLDSDFARCGGGMSGSGIDHVGCHAGVIARNTFTDMSGNAVQAKGGSENIEIRANRMIRAGERAVNLGGSTGTEFFRPPLSATVPNVEARDIRVVSNLIVESTAALAFVGCVDCLAANNTIVRPGNWVLRILQETTTGGGFTFLEVQGGRVVNNVVFYDASVSTAVNVGPNTQAGTFTFQNNLWYRTNNPAQSLPSLPVTETGSVVGQNPNFTNPGALDYSVAPTSPAAGAGTSVPDSGGDLLGRCWASPPSIGAYEPN